jgi:hypothetical protein
VAPDRLFRLCVDLVGDPFVQVILAATAGTPFTRTVVSPLCRVTVAVPAWVSPVLQITHFMFASES